MATLARVGQGSSEFPPPRPQLLFKVHLWASLCVCHSAVMVNCGPAHHWLIFVSAPVSPVTVVSYGVRVVWNLFPSLAGGFRSFVLFLPAWDSWGNCNSLGTIILSVWWPKGGIQVCPFSSFQNYYNVHARNSSCKVCFGSRGSRISFQAVSSAISRPFLGFSKCPFCAVCHAHSVLRLLFIYWPRVLHFFLNLTY